MSSHDDDDIAFDFFDEPETVEATQQQRRRLPRLERPGGRGSGGNGGGERPPRPPLRTPTGLVPLARLVGLIAIAIAIVVALVFWVGSCQGKSKTEEYRGYAAKVRAIANADTKLGEDFAAKLGADARGLKASELETSLQQYAQQEQQAYVQAQQIRAPGPLRQIHQNMIDAVELRAKGLAGLGDALARAGTKKDQSGTVAALTKQGELLTASDAVWEQLYQIPATQQLVAEGVTGVVIPSSHFVQNADTVSSRTFTVLMQQLNGTSPSGPVTGKHGDGITAVRVTPQGSTLSTSTVTTVKTSTELAFVVTVENSGDFDERAVPVKLRITAGHAKISKQHTIPLIGSGESKTVTFTGFDLPPSAYATKATVTATVGKVPGEVYLTNNSATYNVLFSLSGP